MFQSRECSEVTPLPLSTRRFGESPVGGRRNVALSSAQGPSAKEEMPKVLGVILLFFSFSALIQESAWKKEPSASGSPAAPGLFINANSVLNPEMPSS